MRLCSYIITSDTGLAPNPFWGYCTLAMCTPNHQNSTLEKGDWFVGISSKKRGRELIYAMQISEKTGFNEYYHDARFLKKRPNINGTWKERCGDNMYYKENDEWKQHSTNHHTEKGQIKQDTDHPTVFIAEKFYYFGENTVELPDELNYLIKKGPGMKCKRNDEIAQRFVHWLKYNHSTGIQDNPFDREQENNQTCRTC